MAAIAHHLLSRENSVKRQLAAGDSTKGLFVLSCSPIVTELCGTLPLDWLLLDAEAAPLSREGLFGLLQATSGSSVVTFVRVQANQQHEIEHALDAGAQGVLIPKVNNAHEAQRAAQAAFYPPKGTRGVNPVRVSGYFSDVPGYLRRANDETLCMVQIETQEGLDNVAAIAGVPGVDLLFIGPGDLAMAFGQPGNVSGPLMDDARQRVLAAARDAGKWAGIFAYSTELARQYLAEGFTFVAIGNDLKLLRGAIAAEIDAVVSRLPANA